MTEHQQEENWERLAQVIKNALNPVSPAGAASQSLDTSMSTDDEQHLIERYRARVQADPEIYQLQILDMTHPLDVSDIYVKVRLHEQAALSYRVEPEMEQAKDPESLARLQKRLLEQRSSAALDPAGAISAPHRRRFVIVGDPGAGKTTLLKRLALQAAKGELAGLPVCVRLNEFALSNEHDLLAYIAACWEDRYSIPAARARSLLEQRMSRGEVLLLLDALDETAVGESVEVGEQSYRRIAQSISHVAARYEQLRIVVTARKAGYHQRARLTGFTELEVLDFGSEEIRQFIEKWFNAYASPQRRRLGPRLIARLQQNAHVQALAANPLLLSLIVLVYERNLDLPDGRATLYKECIDTLLSKWDATRLVQRVRAFRPEYQKQLLPEIAWHFHHRGLRFFRKQELLPIIGAFLRERMMDPAQAEAVLADMVSENGLLREQAHDIYGFLHLTLQEYFSAQHVLEHNGLNDLLCHLGDPWWEEVILLYAGETPDASPLLQRLLDAEDAPDDIFLSKLVLAGRCLAARPRLRQVGLWDTITQRLLRELQQTPYNLARQQCANTLALIGSAFPDKEINRQLIELLADETGGEALRACIADALGDYGARSLATDLLAYLLKFGTDQVYLARSMYQAIKKLAERTLLPEFLRIMHDKGVDWGLASYAANWIGAVGDATTARSLLPLLNDTTIDHFVRAELALNIVALADDALLASLLTLVGNPGTDHALAGDILEAIEERRDRAAIPLLLQLLTREELASTVRRKIFATLGIIGDESTADQLVRFMTDSAFEIPVTIGGFGLALARCGLRTYRAEILRAFGDRYFNAIYRGNLLLELAKSGDQSLIDDLRNIHAQERNKEARGMIATALAMLGDHSTIPELKAYFIKKNVSNDFRVGSLDREAAAILAQHLTPAEIVSVLTNLDADVQLRIYFARACGETDRTSLVPELLTLLEQQPALIEEVRVEVAKAIGKLGERKETVQRLLYLWRAYRLQDPMNQSDLVQALYEAMWYVSRRAGVTIVETRPGLEVFEVVER